MDKKSFFMLLYVAGIIPIIYDIIIRLHIDNPFFVLGLINILCLLVMTIFIGMQKDRADLSKRRIKGWLFLVIAAVIALGLFSGAIDRLLARGSLWFHEMIMRSNQITIAPTSSDIQSGDLLSGETVIMSGSILTGEQLSGDQALTTSGSDAPSSTSGTVILEGSDDPAVPVTSPSPSSSSSVTRAGLLTYAEVIPHLVKTYNLTMKGSKYPSFSLVSKTSSLYNSFAIAASRSMIGKDINPTTRVSCNTYLVMKGIAAGWEVSYTGLPFDAYRAAAVSRGQVNGCDAGEYVRSTTL